MTDLEAEAQAALKAGRRDEAIALLARGLEDDPVQRGETHLLFLRQLYHAGRHPEGEARARAAVAHHPTVYGLWNILGVFLRVLRRPVEALAALDRAVALNPGESGARVNRGHVLLDLARFDEAAKAFAELVAGEPQAAAHHLSLARALSAAERPDEALAALDAGLALHPQSAALMEAKALLLRACGRLSEVRAFLEELTRRAPDIGWAQFHLGDLLAEEERTRGEAHLRRAVALEPGNLDFLVALVQSLERTAGPGEAAALEEANALARQALALGGLRPGHSQVLHGVFTRLCAFEDAEALGDLRTLGRTWAEAGLHSALLRLLARARTDADRRELLEQHRLWGRAAARRAEATPIRRPPPRAADGKIRLGFVSSDLRSHPVTHFAQPLFDHADARFELYAYSFFRGPQDAVQAKIAAQVAAFRWRPEIGARNAAQMIADDQLDMLIELGGSTSMNRLEVMAWRPAPIQASWLGYPHSAGLAAIDHLICDPYNRPPDPDLLLEAPLELPTSWIAFGAAFSDQPAAVGSPEARNGFVTFGTANQPHKMTREALTAWARIVRRVPHSRFAFIRPEAGAASFRRNVAAAFAAEGVAEERLVFHPVRGGHLPFYGELDISLDTFPLTGGTTTAEALWMGVPVVSLVGQAFFERLSWSILSNAGLADLAASDPGAYAEIAVALAGDPERRRELRASLRNRIRSGPLGRTEQFARDFYEMIARRVAAG